MRDSDDGRLVVKTLLVRPAMPGTVFPFFLGMCTEKAALSIIGPHLGSGVSVKLLRAEDGELTTACELACMITENGGEWTLHELVGGDLRMIARVGAQALRILRSVHAQGIVHGDVHVGNFVYSSEDDPVATLRIIDFGRADTFYDPALGTHVQPGPGPVGPVPHPLLVSPWELRGSRLSRRDDVYRLGEVLLALANSGPLVVPEDLRPADAVGLAAFKDRRQNGPQLLADFHDAMRQLNFEDPPDYETWITRLESE